MVSTSWSWARAATRGLPESLSAERPAASSSTLRARSWSSEDCGPTRTGPRRPWLPPGPDDFAPPEVPTAQARPARRSPAQRDLEDLTAKDPPGADAWLTGVPVRFGFGQGHEQVQRVRV